MQVRNRISFSTFLLLSVLLFFGCRSDNSSTSPESIIENKEAPISQEVDIQNGDIIFHTSRSGQSLAIQIATNSKYSHVGIIYEEKGRFYVFEAVQPVKITPLQEWIDRGEKGHYVVKRLENSSTLLSPEGIAKMKEIGSKYIGRNYDLRFEWSDDKIYCSELVWKIYKQAFNIEVGQLQQIKDFDLSDKVVQAKMKERYGDQVPMDEWIITPDQMFRAENLKTVASKG